jgi:hypothetical protein
MPGKPAADRGLKIDLWVLEVGRGLATERECRHSYQPQIFGRSGSQRGLRFWEGGYLSHISYEALIQYTFRDKNAGIPLGR